MPRGSESTISSGPYKFTTCDYDAPNDVLYLSIGRPREAVTWESPEGHLVRLDPETGALLGLTILQLKSRIARGDVRVTLPDLPSQKPKRLLGKKNEAPNHLVLPGSRLAVCH